MSLQEINEQEKEWLLDEKYNGKVTDEYEKECVLIDQGMPVAYLIGNIPFLGCYIDLSYKPLIPRAETEYWVDLFTKQARDDTDILDIFAGSGCIGVAAAKLLPGSRLDFAELNPENIKQIQKNLEINQVNGSVFESDVFKNVPPKKYDYILANPPYISEKRKNTVQESVQQNEEHGALYASDDGLYFIKQLIEQAPNYLKPNGKLWIEFDPWQEKLLDELLDSNPSFTHRFLEDQYNKPRVLILKKKVEA